MSMGRDLVVTRVATELARQHGIDTLTDPNYEPDDEAIQTWMTAAHRVAGLGEVSPVLDLDTADVIGFTWSMTFRKLKVVVKK